ncbi:endo-1,4-D-glucanase [Burkholderia pseudomallei Pakistan 9]|nr:endo-1,4-D-glucanase [Burkholderia pseudomallei Pakistan 9]
MARQAGRDEGVGRIGREAGDAREVAGAGEACGRRHARADAWARRASRASRGWRTFWRGRGGVRAVVASVVASFSVMAFAAATLPVSWRVAAAAERTRSGDAPRHRQRRRRERHHREARHDARHDGAHAPAPARACVRAAGSRVRRRERLRAVLAALGPFQA